MSKDELRQAQTELKSMGLYDGEVDGLWGPRTRAAVGKFQAQNKLPQTYALDTRTRQQLQSKSGTAGNQGAPQPGSQIGETPPSGTMEAPPIEAPPPPR
jgi:peptidoglycan hydrolase-like protein with peptidoglycan-binding domain